MYLRTLGARGNSDRGDGAELPPGKPHALLTYLACTPGSTASRASVISLLWADLEPDAAKHALRQTLWYLKKKVGQELVTAEGDMLRLSEAVKVDRDELIAASRAGHHERVVSLYTGPFIPDFAAPGGAGFEEWASLERRRLLEVFRHAAEAVIAKSLREGRAPYAVSVAKRLRDQDLYHEGGWRLLIESCLSAGDLLSARAESEALQQLAEREDIDLEPATRALLRTVRQGPAQNGNGSTHTDGSDDTLSPSLVGREREFGALLQSWDAVREGGMRRVHVTSRAGLGKSRLLQDLGSRLRAMRAKVVAVSGVHGTREVEYAVAGELCAGLAALPGKQALSSASAAALIDLHPSLSTFFESAGRPPESGDRLRVRTLALRELLRAVAFEHPIALLIDDLHWWDEASLALLTAVLGSSGDARVLVVTAGRPEVRELPLVHGGGVQHLTLEPLSQGHVEELILSIATLPTDPWATTFAAEVWRASRGSPLLALGVLQHLEHQQLLARRDGAWCTDDPSRLVAVLASIDVLPARIRELERGDLWILTLVAAGRGPLAATVVAAAAERTLPDLVHRLQPLEAQGFVVRDGDLIRSAHDEIADEVLRTAGHDAYLRASTRLGLVLGEDANANETQLRRAYALMRGSPPGGPQEDLFRRFVMLRYSHGDRRAVSALAGDLLGGAATPDEVARVTRSAPWSWRLGLTSPARKMAAALGVAALMLASAMTFIARPSAPPPDAVLAIVFTDSLNQLHFRTVPVHEAAWAPRDSLPLEAFPGSPPLAARTNSLNLDFSPVTGQYVFSQSVSDSGIIDLFLAEPGGVTRRLTHTIRDDERPVFSPDGRQVAYSSAQWSPLFRYDIAVADVATGTVRQLTEGAASDGAAQWSPTGDRIAFGRTNWGLSPNEVCVVPSNGGASACHPVSTDRDVTVLSWLDADRVLYSLAGAEGTETLRAIQWSTKEEWVLLDGTLREPRSSPDARWVYCVCAVSPGAHATPAIFPLSAPSLIRPIAMNVPATWTATHAVWLSARTSQQAATIQINGPAFAYASVPTQLRVTVRDQMGVDLGDRAGVRWSILAGDGSIDSLTGALTSRASSGTLSVVARLLGGASDTLHLALRPSESKVVLTESWTNFSRWILFGAPEPSLGLVPGLGTVFLNNGEGSYSSGVISRDSLRSAGGAYLDAAISTPITLPQWQYIAVHLSTIDPRPYEGSVGLNAYPHMPVDAHSCGLGYAMEGRITRLEHKASLSSGNDRTVRIPVPDLRSGDPWKLRLQYFPDGRCGVAINGVPLAILDSRPRPLGALRALLQGNSYQTRIAVGPLRLVQGVGLDIDWARAPIIR